MFRNRHPADLLADVRAEIKQLQIQEAELRNELLHAEASDRSGIQWIAQVCNVTQERLDAKAAIRHFGDAIRPFLTSSTMQQVRLKLARKNRQKTPKSVATGNETFVTQKDTLQ